MAEIIQNKEAVTYGTYVNMQTIICYKCAIPFAVPSEFQANLRKTQEAFYCPNGHEQYYTKSTETILREKLAAKEAEEQRLKALVNDKISEAHACRIQSEKERQAKKRVEAKLKRVEKRISNGVCPCCNRTFQDLAKHMKSKHPEQLKS